MAIEIKQQSVEDLIVKELNEGRGYRAIIERFQNSVVVGALTLTHGNVTRAAVLLKVHRNNLIRWMRMSGLDRHFFIDDDNGQHAEKP